MKYALAILKRDKLEYCKDALQEDIVRCSYSDIMNAVDDAIEKYGGKKVFVVDVKTKEILTDIVVPNILETL